MHIVFKKLAPSLFSDVVQNFGANQLGHVNAVRTSLLEQDSFRNESHSRIMRIAPLFYGSVKDRLLF